MGAEALVARVLALGAWGSGGLVAAGLLAQAAGLPGRGLVRLGILVLVATPFLRVATMAAAFTRRGERRFALSAYAVLALMVAGMLLGLRG